MPFIEFNQVPDLKLRYPLFFQESYAQYERTKEWEVKIFTDGKSFVPVKIKAGRLIKQAQYLFPPVCNGERLTEQDEKIFLEKFCSQKRAREKNLHMFLCVRSWLNRIPPRNSIVF